MDMLITLCIIALVLLAIVLLNVVAWPGFAWTTQIHPYRVAVLIPARNEENNLSACLASVIAQDETVAEILVYDDHSADATPQIVQQFMALDSRVRLIAPDELPSGWCGKNFACYRLADHASSQWLLFLDADARLAPGAARRMVTEALCRHVTLISAWPRLVMHSVVEQVVMPLLDFVTFTLFPAPLSLRRNDVSLGLVHGACILAERSTYNHIGGHSVVRGEILEDQRIAQEWRRQGERGVCLYGADVVSVRMYDSFAGFWMGFGKNFYPGFRHGINFWLFLLLHFSVFLFPFLLLLVIPSMQVLVAAGAVLLMRLLMAIRFHHPLWSVLLHPVAEIVLLALGVSSWWRYRNGGVEWRGRTYGASKEESPVVAEQTIHSS